MILMVRHYVYLSLAFIFIATMNGCKENTDTNEDFSGELILFHAGSLSVPLAQLSDSFMREHPDARVLAEAAGSRDTARKVSDLGRPCDVLASADWRVAQDLLMPDHAAFNIQFATNEMAIAYNAQSAQGERIAPDNWPEILLREDVVFGRADPNRDPCGYRTAMAFQLAEKHYGMPGLAKKLDAQTSAVICQSPNFFGTLDPVPLK